jgi:hypothetical protein
MSLPERRAMVERAKRDFVGSPAMYAAESFSFGRLSSRAGDLPRRSGHDAADRRVASEVAILRLAANGNSTTPAATGCGRGRHAGVQKPAHEATSLSRPGNQAKRC